MTVVMIISSMILPTSAVMVPVPVPFTVTIPIPVSFPILVAVVTATVSVSVSLAVPPILAVLTVFVSVLSILRGFLTLTASGRPAVLGSFLLAKPFLLPFDELGEGGPASLFVFERLEFAQMFKEWYGLSDG